MAIDPSRPTTRRGILLGALAGLAGGAATALASAGRVLAAGSDGAAVVVGGNYLDVRTTTALQNVATNQGIFELIASGSAPALDVVGNVGDAIHGFGTVGTGVKGTTGSNAGFGVVGSAPYVAIKGASFTTGSTGGSGVGVFGTSAASDGAGVDGRGPNVGVHGKSAGTAVYGEGTGGGTGVRGNATGGGIGLLGNSDTYRAIVGVVSGPSGTTIGVFGESFSSAGTGMRGWAAGGGTGVYGFSGGSFPSGNPPAQVGVVGGAPAGRGGQFSGGQAQIRLVPSSAATHPASGQAGDLFVDSSKRLWFCKGGTTWKLLA